MKSWGLDFLASLLFACFFLSVIYGSDPYAAEYRKVLIHRKLDNKGQAVKIAEFYAEVISSNREYAKGLSGRDMIDKGRAMLFILDTDRKYLFWMKDMKFPIDIILFDKEKRIFEVFENLVPCNGYECKYYMPEKSPYFALEVNAGTFSDLGMMIGDYIEVEELP